MPITVIKDGKVIAVTTNLRLIDDLYLKWLENNFKVKIEKSQKR